MSKEQRTFISPSDILGIEYECDHCRSRHFVPLERFDRVLYQCPNCNEALATRTQAGDARAKDDVILEAFVKDLTALKALNVKIKLEINES
jgi:DNA-directed RNA polymerase subunit RPC12/RpoP